MKKLEKEDNAGNLPDIKKRVKELEQECSVLQKSEEKFRTIFNASVSAIMLLDDAGFFECNAATLRIFGCKTREEFLGRHPSEWSPAMQADGRNSREASEDKIAAAFREGFNHFEWTHLRANKEEFPAEVFLAPIRLREKTVLQATVLDITNRKKMEKELIMSERTAKEERARAEAIIAGMGDGISIQNKDFKILYQNDVHKGFLGAHEGEYCYKAYERNEDVCEGCPVAMTFKDNNIHIELRKNVITGRGLSHFEITSSPLKDFDGNVVAAIEIVREITERIKNEEALIKKETNLAEAQKIAHIGSWELDLINNELQWSDEIFRIFGLDPELFKVTYEGFLDSVHIEDREFVDAAYTDSVKRKKPYELIHRIILPDGETRTVNEKCEQCLNKEGEVVRSIGTLHDITERKKIEAELEELNKELEQVIYTTSHDLRSPLVNIEGYVKEVEYSLEEVEAVLKEVKLPDDIHRKILSIIQKDIPESVVYIDKSIKKMESLLSGLLVLSRSGKTNLVEEELDMFSLVNDVVATLEHQFREAGVKYEISELPLFFGDKKQINQLFTNLIGNALKYLDTERPGMIKVFSEKEDGLTAYCVEDNGIGISPEDQERIFDLFHQVEPGKDGEGLGLNIVKKIVERHRGKVRVESEPDKGSKFCVSLPIKAGNTLRQAQDDKNRV